MPNDITETEYEQPTGWYVSRVVNLPSSQIQALGLLGGIVTPSGAFLKIGEAVEHNLPLEDHQTYSATLSFPGIIPTKLKVELLVARYSGTLAEIGLRPIARVPQRIGAERYFEAAWAVVEGVARAGREGVDAVAERSLPRARRFARAS
jgi:hypothetical protein